jgi:hypothetical protein
MLNIQYFLHTILLKISRFPNTKLLVSKLPRYTYYRESIQVEPIPIEPKQK